MPKKDVPLSRVGNPQHNNVVYKHGGHSLVDVDISFHRSILGSRAPDAVHHINDRTRKFKCLIPNNIEVYLKSYNITTGLDWGE